MKRKKRTPEELRAWWQARDARIRELRAREERIRAELEVKKKPA